HNETADRGKRFTLRIGIHLGEIWRDGDRVFGNGVNVAARVQPKAPPGGICITEDVYRQVANKLSSTIESIGVHELKNISRRLELYQVITGHEERPPRGEEAGEFDAIKQRILREREAIAARHADRHLAANSDADRAESSFEHRIESKVFSVVERVMDTAITKWDQMPEDKKSRAIARIQQEIAKDDESDIEIHLGDSKHSGGETKSEGSEVLSRLGAGVVFGTGFGIGYFSLGIGWMVWPFAILGLLPLAGGVLKGLKLLARSERRRRERPLQLERLLLQTARRVGGSLTVVRAASETGIPLDEIQLTLDRMTAKGYVAQQISESGIIEYEFPSLSE
ncbi:MAG: adenylate/guanylate cyclase domain-containing protein, partial [Spirochaetota bacterium]